MKKYIAIATAFIACLALCAAVRPQSEIVEETHAAVQVTAVSAPEPAVEDISSEEEASPPTEEEKVEIPQVKPLHEDISEPEPVSEEIPVISEAQPLSEPEPELMPEEIPMSPKVQPILEPEPEPVLVPTSTSTPAPAPSQAVTEPQSSDMVYVPGFGWLDSQGSGEAIYDENMYENGNKIGVME